MRKIYSLVLMTAMLFVGTNAWADNVAEVTKGGSTQGFESLPLAFASVSAGETATITLTDNVELNQVILMNGGNDNSALSKHITLNLNNHTITGTDRTKCIFVLTKGYFEITGKGTISFDGYNNNYGVKWIGAQQGVCVAVFGSVDPTASDWSHLVVGDSVKLIAAYAAVQLHANSGLNNPLYGFSGNKYWTAWPTSDTTSVYSDLNASDNETLSTIKDLCTDGETLIESGTGYIKKRPGQKVVLGFGYGINVDIYGTLIGRLYGLQIKGTITGTPNIPLNNAGANFPRINVYPRSVIQADAANSDEFPAEGKGFKQPTAIYASGYAIWDIQGNVTGANGVYVKMGQIVVQGNANISSNATDTITAHHTSSGVSGVGNAITLQSDWEDGTMGITIKADENGGTPEISSSAIGGAAIVETNTTTDLEQQVQNITIEAGEFSGDVNGCVVISDNFDGDISVSGGTYTGSIETLIEAMKDDSTNVIQTVVAQNGNTATVVIGQKAEGDDLVNTNTEDAIDNFAFVADMSNDIVKLDAQVKPISKDLGNLTHVTVKYLSLTGKNADTLSVVTVGSGKTLEVGQIVMNAYGRLIVEAGGKLVVTGTNGIFADDVNNLVLEAVEGNQSIFLFNPNVKTNRHPHATVELISKGRTVGGHQYWQRFGIPDYTGMTRAEIERTNPTAFKYIDLEDDQWKDMPAGEDMVPFIMYAMSTLQSTKDTYKFKCELVGNVNFKLPFEDHSWNYFANSYTGRMDIAELFDCLDAAAGRDRSAYIYQPENDWWDIVNIGNLEEGNAAQTVLDPMQAFIIKNNGVSANDSVNYRDVVWIPATSPAPAPARVMDSNLTKVVVTIMDENGKKSNVTLRQSNRFSDEYDNGYDTEILMNPNFFNVYASTEFGNMAHVATDNIAGATLTIATKEETMFTMTFSDIRGQQLAIRDRLTGTITMMNESAVYYFATSANDICERFDIIEPQQMPTDVEVVENGNEVHSSIYSVMGQYMGEDWSSLPKGIYIVNGNKVVK